MENSRDAAMDDIVRRLEFVETRHVASLQETLALRVANRRLTLVSFALGAGLILMFALGATKPASVPDVIRAKKLEIVDDAGNRRAVLMVSSVGPGLNMYDENGKELVELTATHDETALNLHNGETKSRATLKATAAESHFSLTGYEGKSAAFIRAMGGGPELELINDMGRTMTYLGQMGNGIVFQLFDNRGKPVWRAPEPH